jgi:beta-N-acetylhexosaminidase
MASGELPWSLAAPLAERIPGTEVQEVTGPTELAVGGRSLVVVVRDPNRHPWQWHLVEAARRHPSAVVVDVGWPAELPDEVAVVRTRGVAPGLLTAAADRLGSA